MENRAYDELMRRLSPEIKPDDWEMTGMHDDNRGAC
tara:strand:- start:3584 stop:3691 length:108 start_codon:yes stop_codon:yes gene_type:complete